MKILVLSWRGPGHPLSGGAEQVMHEHMKGWISAGHAVTLFTSSYSNAKKNEVFDGVNILRYGSQFVTVQLCAFFWYLFNSNFDLVVDQFHGIPFFTPLYVSRKKLAVIQEVAREVWLKNDLSWPFNFIIGTLGYLVEPLVFLFYKRIKFITGSLSAKQDLQKMGIPKENVFVVPHGVIAIKPKNTKKEKIETVTFLGAIARDKGIEDAIEVFSKLSKRKKIQFWIIGKGGSEYLKVIKQKCSELKIYKKVRFWGFVSQTKKFTLLAKTHVMINPSYKEGWGLVNIEANSVGTPVVAYKNPGLVDSVKNNISGILTANNPFALAAAVTEILDNKNKLHQLSKSAIVWSRNFTWEKSKKMSQKIIEKL